MAAVSSSRDPEAAEPVCVAHQPDDLLVMYHRPLPGTERGTAVLICPPFGWQADCSYRGLRTWGRRLVPLGTPPRG